MKQHKSWITIVLLASVLSALACGTQGSLPAPQATSAPTVAFTATDIPASPAPKSSNTPKPANTQKPTNTTAPTIAATATITPTATLTPTDTISPPTVTRTRAPAATQPQPTQAPLATATLGLPTDTAVPAAPPTDTQQPPQPTAPPAVCDCSGDIYNCGDFSTHAQALACFNYCFPIAGDVHGLDNDNDGDPCESLPVFVNGKWRTCWGDKL